MKSTTTTEIVKEFALVPKRVTSGKWVWWEEYYLERTYYHPSFTKQNYRYLDTVTYTQYEFFLKKLQKK